MHSNYWAVKKLNWQGYEATLNGTDLSCYASIQPWQEQIMRWYGRQLLAMANNINPHPKAIFIWGPSRTGKSMTVDKLCSNTRAIYKPTNTRFPFGCFDPLLHKIIKFEDFDLKRNQMPMDQLLSLLEGAEFSADRKHSDHFTIAVKIPIIFISNFPPEINSEDPVIKAFFNRFSIVEAHTPIELVNSVANLQEWNDLTKPQPCDNISFTELLSSQQRRIGAHTVELSENAENGVVTAHFDDSILDFDSLVGETSILNSTANEDDGAPADGVTIGQLKHLNLEAVDVDEGS